jgi:hypothetical protein
MVGAGVVVGEVVGATGGEVVVEEVGPGFGTDVGGGPVGVVVEGVVVVSVGLGALGVSTRMTSLSAPAPTDVSLTNALPVKSSVQL